MAKVSLEKDKIKILLLEGLHPSSVEVLQAAGYSNIEYHKGSLEEAELIEAIQDVHFIGIRSRTNLTEKVINAANKLVAIGCFCIGTNQVNLDAAAKRGIPVFNAPFSNTRSVAELVLGEILLLLRGIPEKNALAHRGIWKKSADNSYEARGKCLGIIGYGHIGTQLGIIAENLGMRVYFYDIENKLSLGNATQVHTMSELLNKCDVISLHVPETPETKNMMGKEEFARMKPGSIFINAARGTVVDIPALCDALASGHIAGAAVDVFPVEPGSNKEAFESPLIEFDNVLLTPHVGGSTQEAQENIGIEVAGKLAKYSDNGSTLSSVNFPEVSLPQHRDCSRLLHIHENRPGILTQINTIFAQDGINVAAQYLQTNASIGYVVIEVETARSEEALAKLKSIDGTIRARILH
ncbi:phosphoglycerate dehydrogenase [Vibrio cincinnatiensis]|jgi:D-3-phosphoglycerate dehydrogenase|uniref:D-3-phosphoglycerate dehydrogenase n=1 Tax=Vibrio cincinnatiensis DSM 19608 TaxID=1123491 RepID=A0A1T4P7A6_VIBCI|nr:phosphoglycerate dehydrogenase [Vibrio cincinnatiensis]MCG3723407.1 phosphoglycerate dehydrogenase [Vibrio cincinnatiensis]MCG3724466.1 phosphoglycerate dehydrogenase [Vibrio cincinnatiensis]MCG3731397.1 phosphoglycerate dehydrogenase [Vibrio cincinnatiensis]MCG3735221.1 phosphoglycerate dehydrogenase [Vibrio cincinnatiensis]MCG3739092.1 phosphoglycerate dehydrogenase [Vibrio cincinnatiensis]